METMSRRLYYYLPGKEWTHDVYENCYPLYSKLSNWEKEGWRVELTEYEHSVISSIPKDLWNLLYHPPVAATGVNVDVHNFVTERTVPSRDVYLHQIKGIHDVLDLSPESMLYIRVEVTQSTLEEIMLHISHVSKAIENRSPHDDYRGLLANELGYNHFLNRLTILLPNDTDTSTILALRAIIRISNLERRICLGNRGNAPLPPLMQIERYVPWCLMRYLFENEAKYAALLEVVEIIMMMIADRGTAWLHGDKSKDEIDTVSKEIETRIVARTYDGRMAPKDKYGFYQYSP